MSRVIFMCGPAGSGKTTYTKQLEAQGMTRLSFDTAAWERGIKTMPLPPEVHAEIKADLQTRLLRLVQEWYWIFRFTRGPCGTSGGRCWPR